MTPSSPFNNPAHWFALRRNTSMEGDLVNMSEIIANTLNILKEQAQHGEPITYGGLLGRLGIDLKGRPAGQVATPPYLNLVAVYCMGAGVPPLTVLVVNGPRSKNPGQPGDGFYTWFPDANAARQAVDRHNWENSPLPPFPRYP